MDYWNELKRIWKSANYIQIRISTEENSNEMYKNLEKIIR